MIGTKRGSVKKHSSLLRILITKYDLVNQDNLQ